MPATRRRLMPLLALVLPLVLPLAVAPPAAAQDRPLLFPARDVAVTYRVTGTQAGPREVTLSWLAARHLLRADLGGTGYVVADPRAPRGFMVMEQMRMVMDVPVNQALAGLPASGRFRRAGQDRVAGHACQIWHYEEGNDRGTACITADGVTLRAEGRARGESGRVEATRVAYGAQDPARFVRPQGYQAMQLPQGLPPGLLQGLAGVPRR
ncbi:hypothetical protein [Falsiroseomonas tokyonensis]|uniref:DUF4412 domain-containing protein n=1 Tax=Falsiroseomonas tokyonensis TaxID=430521 RepID=A0ABV7BU90_9PROT|nr:hypothetical protein [Falsiroseomonas tokyonensis]MBU8539224.1 hypothetical protein [Falsiroseomonas tokyonensis]